MKLGTYIRRIVIAVVLVFTVILLVAGIAFTVWVICTPDLPLWVKLLLLK